MALSAPDRTDAAAPMRRWESLAHLAAAAAAVLAAASLLGTPAQAVLSLAGQARTVPAPATTRAAGPPAAASQPAAGRSAGTAGGRYVPAGTGMWIYTYADTVGGDAKQIVAQARANGLSTLYVRTGSSWDGLTARPLGQLLSASRGSGLAIVAWDFPSLTDPVADARRLAAAAWLDRRVRGAAGVRAVAPDIETPAEGTDLTLARVTTYLSTLRRLLPPNVSILPAVPWPSQYRVGSYPYQRVADFADGFLPMDYWYTNNPGVVTLQTVEYLRRFHRPIVPVGQGYNSQQDDPWLPPSHPRRELAEFLHVAHAARLPGISLWDWQTSTPAQWSALALARRLFPAPAPAHPGLPHPAAPHRVAVTARRSAALRLPSPLLLPALRSSLPPPALRRLPVLSPAPVASRGDEGRPAPARGPLPSRLGVRALW